MNIVDRLNNFINGPVENMGRKQAPSATAEATTGPAPQRVETSPTQIHESTRAFGRGELKSVTLPQRAPDELARFPYLRNEQLAAIGNAAGYRLPREVSEGIADLQAKYDAAYSGLLAHTYDRARADWRANDAMIAEKVARGEDVTGLDAWEEADYVEDYRSKSRAFSDAMKSLSRQAFDLIVDHVEEYATKAEALAERITFAEQETHIRFGLAYTPSAVVLACKKAAHQVRQIASTFHGDSGMPPKSVCSFVPVQTSNP